MQSKYFCRKSQKTVLWSFFVCFDKNRFLRGASFAFVSKFVLERGDSGWSNFQLIEFLIGRKADNLKILHLQLLTSDGLNFAKARSSWQRQNKFLFDRTSIKDFFLVLLTSLSHSINWKIDQTGSSRPENKLGCGKRLFCSEGSSYEHHLDRCDVGEIWHHRHLSLWTFHCRLREKKVGVRKDWRKKSGSEVKRALSFWARPNLELLKSSLDK